MSLLAYSLPAFRADGYRDASRWLDSLLALGFRWVTFHPTYAVDESTLRIHSGPELHEAFRCARELGLHIRMEPHLDWHGSLNGGPYRWRRDMLIQPGGEYFDRVLAPLADFAPDELTLGSELDLSADKYADVWAEVAALLRPSGIALGHKLNHDWRGGRRLRRYLRDLDYVAISFYPPGRWRLKPEYTVGEFGLGSTDLKRPWHFDSTTFRTAEDFELRRGYYLEMLEWLRGRNGRAACFWTAGHFDVLGIMHPQWRDDAVLEAVREYNQASP